ncbi:iron chelate uptake ABC transporter family permease subunit [Halomicrobium sp. ZPS1]|uniref:Transport system permease protein n=2 Tax=Halomicrobium mukohataei TaxID=57705 RepID=C7NXU2_HALMD|nr:MULTISPECIES: iron chelate uptake ABC transporter family permease subunit [Halomicrobium]ACV46530.1 transport system permease protein [Halomicrobium mukohataei DSM 12286]QCD65073.1 hypothetical protein E5139_05250 [Halomicrobium mukohataei]QFR19879.1 iron chelate uptake ABC transporter family permease subunit [Halomicrobium sp. ZPS1]
MAGTHPTDTPTEVGHQRSWLTGRLAAFCLASAAITVFAGLLQVSFGSYSMTIAEAWRSVFDPSIVFDPAVWNIRLPRVLVAVVTGATLDVSGAIFQAVARNELASPYILGVSSGAGLAVLLTLVVFSGLTPFLPLIAAAGGTVAFALVYAIAWKGGTSPVRLVLAGVIVGTVFQSLQTGVFFFADDLVVVQSAIAWTTGSLTGTDWEQVRLSIVPATFAIVLAQAARFADNLVAMRDGQLYDWGPPREVVTEQLLADVFGVEARIQHEPELQILPSGLSRNDLASIFPRLNFSDLGIYPLNRSHSGVEHTS